MIELFKKLLFILCDICKKIPLITIKFLCIGCYPFTDRDPFFIESCPHVYFVGNQDKYATRILKGFHHNILSYLFISFKNMYQG